ncbi:MAG TPA: AraC family transcriptional regulator ligand-binding domain-containing protein [Polyangia bacterium]|nr:AraC family transcriptional regulator ligand-binding domain-containing protein [Polyangia bacterium]
MAFATLPAIFVIAVAEAVAARGGAREEIVAASGLTAAQLAAPEAPVPMQAVFAAWERAMRLLRDASFPVFYAQRFEVERYPLLGFAIMTAPTVREAFARVMRFSAIVTTSGHWSKREEGELVTLVWHREGPRTLGQRVANEAAVAEAVRALRQILGRELAVQVRLRHQAPPSSRAHDDYFGARVRWAADEDAIELPRAVLDEAPRFANLAMASYFDAQAEERLAALRRAETVRDATARLVGELLVSGEPGVGVVARQLGMSERSLRRALADEGTSFRRVVDEVRLHRAQTLLQEGEHALAEIAFALGFSEHAAFTRAFKRWTGKSPQQTRRR